MLLPPTMLIRTFGARWSGKRAQEKRNTFADADIHPAGRLGAQVQPYRGAPLRPCAAFDHTTVATASAMGLLLLSHDGGMSCMREPIATYQNPNVKSIMNGTELQMSAAMENSVR
jgi:hypothetical protein